jgi:hypothetical protein
MNNELERIQKEADMSWSRYYGDIAWDGYDKEHEKPQPGWPVFQPRFESSTR